MRDPLHRLSVKTKLSLLFAGLCLIAFGVGGLLVSWSAQVALEDAIRGRIETTCSMVTRSLDDELSLLTRRAEDFASDGYIRERVQWLTRPSTGDDESLPEQAAELEEHLARNKLPLAAAFVGLGILDPDGRPRALVGDATPELAAKAAARDAPHGASRSPDGSTTQWVTTPIRSLDGTETIGRLVVWIDTWTWIVSAVEPEEVADVIPSLGDSARLRLESPEGIVVVATPAKEEGGLRRVLEPRQASQGRPEVLISRSHVVAENGWAAHVLVPSLEAYAPISGLQSRFLGVGVLLAVSSGLLLFFPMRFLVQPLGVLRDAARRIREGDYATRVPVESSDEVGELALAFNHMASAVESQTRELHEAADELRRGEQRLRVERDRLDTVIHSLRDGLLVLDETGEPVLANDAAAPFVELLRRRADALTSHYECAEADRETTCAGCLVQPDAPSRLCVLDVGGRTYEVHAAMIAPDSQGARGRVLVARDITDRVNRDEREIHQERLSVLGEVAAVLAHELNNPLTSIRMFAQMMADELPPDAPHREHVDVVLRNTEVCRRSIRELLGYANDSAPTAERVELADVLRDVARFVRPLADRAGVRIELQDDGVACELNADEIQLRQLFVNLLMNAVQAAEEPGGTVKVDWRMRRDSVHVDVIDSGPGIPEELQPRIFDAFVSSKPRGEGTGLGLPTARRIAELHGGGLDLIESRPGRTHFRVRLVAHTRVADPATSEAS